MASGAMPHGRLASDSLVANANLSSRDHLLTGVNKADPDDIVKPLEGWQGWRVAPSVPRSGRNLRGDSPVFEYSFSPMNAG